MLFLNTAATAAGPMWCSRCTATPTGGTIQPRFGPAYINQRTSNHARGGGSKMMKIDSFLWAKAMDSACPSSVPEIDRFLLMVAAGNTAQVAGLCRQVQGLQNCSNLTTLNWHLMCREAWALGRWLPPALWSQNRHSYYRCCLINMRLWKCSFLAMLIWESRPRGFEVF